MTNPPSKNDPSAEWPEDVRKAYEHLKIPSLYDAVMANEKLSLEIRRQDRDLKTVVEGIQTLSTQLTSLLKIVEEEWEEYEEEDDESIATPQNGFEDATPEELKELEQQFLEENPGYLEKQAQEMLMETHDDMQNLSRITRQVAQQLFSLLPKKEGLIPRVPTWHPVAENILQSLVEAIEHTRYQLLVRMEDVQIEMVNPQPGEAFNQALHHALDHISGGKPGTIARVVRVGYRQNQEVLRLAEVTLYQA